MKAAQKSAEQAITDRSRDGVHTHDMTGGWRVVVAKHGDHHATWYYHINDDERIGVALEREAHRRLAVWKHAEMIGVDGKEGG